MRVHLTCSYAILVAATLCAAGVYAREADIGGYRTTNLREPQFASL